MHLCGKFLADLIARAIFTAEDSENDEIRRAEAARSRVILRLKQMGKSERVKERLAAAFSEFQLEPRVVEDNLSTFHPQIRK
jgi:hypothetical protein